MVSDIVSYQDGRLSTRPAVMQVTLKMAAVSTRCADHDGHTSFGV